MRSGSSGDRLSVFIIPVIVVLCELGLFRFQNFYAAGKGRVVRHAVEIGEDFVRFDRKIFEQKNLSRERQRHVGNLPATANVPLLHQEMSALVEMP